MLSNESWVLPTPHTSPSGSPVMSLRLWGGSGSLGERVKNPSMNAIDQARYCNQGL